MEMNKEKHSFGAMLVYQSKWNEDLHEAYGVVTLSIDISDLISERQIKISKYDIWGDKDYWLHTEDLTDQWYALDSPKYTATFETYSPDFIGEDYGYGILSFTLPDGRIVSKDVKIDGNRNNMRLLILTGGDKESNYLATYTLTPKE